MNGWPCYDLQYGGLRRRTGPGELWQPTPGCGPIVVGSERQSEPLVRYPQISVATDKGRVRSDGFDFLRDHSDIDRGDPAKPVAARRGVRMGFGIFMDLLGDLVRFHISLSGLMRKFRNLSQRISRRESARPQLSNILAYAAFWPRERAAMCGSTR